MDETFEQQQEQANLARTSLPSPPFGFYHPHSIAGQNGASSISSQSENAIPRATTTPESTPPIKDLSPAALKGSDLSKATTPSGVGESAIQYQAQISHYGYDDDPYMDSYTKKGLGNSNNRLQTGIVAIDPESRARYGVKNGDIVSFTLGDGTQYAGYVGDTTATGLGPRFDVYDPSGKMIVRDDGRKGLITIETRAPEAYKGRKLDIEGPRLLQEFIDRQNNQAQVR